MPSPTMAQTQRTTAKPKPAAAITAAVSPTLAPAWIPGTRPAPERLTPQAVLQLQSLAGNRAVVGLVQRDTSSDNARPATTKLKPHQVKLEFVPDVGTDAQGKPIGELRVYVSGRRVAAYEARGGGPESIADSTNPQRTYGPTTPGVWRLAGGKSHVSRGRTDKRGKYTPPWPFSQLAWGTPILDRGPKDGVDYRRDDGKWASTETLEVPITRNMIIDALKGLTETTHQDKPVQIPKTWSLNDFGKEAYHIRGTSDFIHTTPQTEEAYRQGLEEQLVLSHGCIHIKPSDRDTMVDHGYLQAGVKVIIRKYRTQAGSDRLR